MTLTGRLFRSPSSCPVPLLPLLEFHWPEISCVGPACPRELVCRENRRRQLSSWWYGTVPACSNQTPANRRAQIVRSCAGCQTYLLGGRKPGPEFSRFPPCAYRECEGGRKARDAPCPGSR